MKKKFKIFNLIGGLLIIVVFAMVFIKINSPSIFVNGNLQSKLIKACNENNVEKVKKNLPNATQNDIKEAIFINLESEKSQIAIELIKALNDLNVKGIGGDTLLISSVKMKNKIICEYLINKNVDVNVLNNAGISPLMFAVDSNDKTIVSKLIEKGADINIKSKEGANCLFIAVERGNIDMYNFLISKGIERVKKNNKEQTLLHKAAISGSKDMFQCLVNEGFNINDKDSKGKKVTHYVTSTDLMSLLLEKYKMDINEKSLDEETPLFSTIMNGKPQLVEYIIKKGGQINSVDKLGTTPLSLAVQLDNYECAKVLIAAGANKDIKDNNAKLPIDYAKELKLSNGKKFIDLLK